MFRISRYRGYEFRHVLRHDVRDSLNLCADMQYAVQKDSPESAVKVSEFPADQRGDGCDVATHSSPPCPEWLSTAASISGCSAVAHLLPLLIELASRHTATRQEKLNRPHFELEQ